MSKNAIIQIGSAIWKHKIAIFLWIINLLSILFLLQIVFEVIPVFECNYTSSKITKINDFVKDMSIGIITSTFFYWLLVVMPENQRKRNIRKKYLPVLNNIVNTMQVIIAYLAEAYSLGPTTKNYSQIDVNAFDKVTDILNRQTNFWYEYHDRENSFCDVSLWTELSFIYSRIDNIEHATTFYLNIPLIIFEDVELVMLISQISQCKFISDIRLLQSFRVKIEGTTIDNISVDIKEFYSLYRELLKYTKPNTLEIKGNKPKNRTPIPVTYK